MRERDKRSTEIKKILRANYPQAKFKVRKGKACIWAYTDLFKNPFEVVPDLYYLRQELKREGLGGEKLERWREFNRRWEKKEAVTREIKKLLRNYWNVEYDEFTNEILQGVNTFLFVESLDKEREG